MASSKLYHVVFHEPVEGKRDYYFRSVGAIYNHFSEDQVGIKLGTLHNSCPKPDGYRATKKCIIYREDILK